jgi:expansin (peptidoglycan-binding protein)
VRRRWLVASVVAAFLIAAGLVAGLVLALLPDPQTAAGHAAATPAVDGRAAIEDGSGTPLVAGPASGSASATVASPPTSTPATSGRSTPATPGRSTPTTQASPAPASGPALLAGRIKPGVSYRGVATFYGATGGGNCMFDPGGDLMVAAMNATDYEGSKACGASVLVRSSSGATITVRITDQCPECAVGQLDLSAQAFAKLATPSAGRIPITWKLVSPDLSGSIGIRYKTGSSPYWCAIQVINHRNPLASVEIRSGATWKPLSRSDYNYFLSPSGSGCGGSLRITDIYGQRLVVSGLPVRPNVTQTTRVQFAKH